MPDPPWTVDVVVVGAGFAGLAAARELTRRGHDVLVFEGRDRVGGRSFTGNVAGLPVDMGGTFVGPTQDAVLALADELGFRPPRPITTGKPDPVAWLVALLQRHHSQAVVGRADRPRPLALAIRENRPRRSAGRALDRPTRRTLDGLSLGEWLRSVRAGATSRDLMAIMSRVTWGCEPDDVSMLHAARYVHAAGGLDRMLDVENGAQQDRFSAARSRSPTRRRPNSATGSC